MGQPSKSYKPEGFPALIPYFAVRDADAFIQFLVNSFGAMELNRHTAPDGTVRYAAVRIGDSVVEIAEARPQDAVIPMTLHLYVANADDSYKSALKYGATSLIEPEDTYYGERTAAVVDSNGNFWYLATRVEDLPWTELEQRARHSDKAS
jgi:PhnB protein